MARHDSTELPTPEVAAISCACFNLRRTARIVTRLYDAALQPTGLRCTQFSLLVGIQVNEPVSLSELAARLGMDRTTLTRNLRPLISKRLVQAHPNPSDQRAREISLTPKGRRKLQSALPRWEHAQRSVIQGLGRSAWTSLYSLLGRTAALVEGATSDV